MNPNPWICFLAAAFGGLFGVLVALREPKSFAARAFAAGMAALAAESLFAGLSISAPLAGATIDWQRWRLVCVAFLPAAWLVFSLCYSRTNYRDFLRAWMPVLVVSFLLPVGVAVLMFRELVTGILPQADEARVHVACLGLSGRLVTGMALVGLVLSLMNLEKTFRAAVGTMRWRVKFMVLGLGIVLAVRIHGMTQMLLWSAATPGVDMLNAGATLLGCTLLLGSYGRARLVGADLYLSFTLLHHSLVVLLVGVYMLVVGLLTWWVPYAGMVFVAGLVGLCVLLASDRLRVGMKRFVSRHLHRPQYDYRHVWAAFTRRTASLNDASEFCRAAVRMVSDTLEALSVSIWLVDEARGTVVFGASTSLTRDKAWNPAGTGGQTPAIVAGLRETSRPLDMDVSCTPWVKALRAHVPDQFPGRGGNQLCVALRVGEELVGFMTVGDRVSGISHSLEEFDLLATVAEQAAAGLLGIRLSERVMEAKQMEAFQTMSAFFVHDLKNTASTLSLMLHNVSRHFEDPQFRKDALVTISKGVDRINDLVRRLSLLRRRLSIRTLSADMGELARRVLDGLPEFAGTEVVPELEARLPAAALDQEQMETVITNLVLNARDAAPDGGLIRVRTALQDGFVSLAVTDNGCGMSPDFVRDSLFRPFRSTKKDGMGIGLFQSKMIVEAHRGRIEIESREGKGSTFRVLVPVARGKPDPGSVPEEET